MTNHLDHLYVSTACQHQIHLDCWITGTRWDGGIKKRATCKYCPAPCLCSCHDLAAATISAMIEAARSKTL